MASLFTAEVAPAVVRSFRLERQDDNGSGGNANDRVRKCFWLTTNDRDHRIPRH